MANIKVPLTFRIFQGDKLIREDKLSLGVIKLGKVPSAHLRIDDETVSRMHAIVEVTSADDISIIDLGSTRGTFVNGQRINKAKLCTGDSIEVGNTRIEFAVDALAVEPVAAPVAAAPAVKLVPPPVPAFTPAVAKSAAPIAAPIATPVAARATLASPAIATAFDIDIDDAGGARSVEVAAMLGDSVVDVKHCLDPKSGKVSTTTWAFLAAGALSLIASAIAFAVSVNNATVNQDAREAWKAQGKPERMFPEHHLGFGFDWVAFGGLALGLGGLTTALVRARGEKRSPFYRIGTAAGVEMPVDNAPAPSFPLVAPSGDDFVFNYGHGMDGELIVDGRSTPLAELVAAGRARPSTTTAGAIELQIPAKARIRARAGNTTFLVSAVSRPRRYAAPFLAGLEGRALAYIGGSAAFHLAIWGLLQAVPVDDGSIGVDLATDDIALTHASTTSHDDPAPIPPEDNYAGEAGDPGGGMAMTLPSGTAGTPDSANKTGGLQIAKRDDDAPRLSRIQAIEAARSAGFLGSSALEGGIQSIVAMSDSSNGLDAHDVWGPIYGADGEGHGSFGFGRNGDLLGGGCGGTGCGIIGSGGYKTIGDVGGPGNGIGGFGHGHGWGRNHVAATPPVVIGQPIAGDGIDKTIIRRYIKRSQDRIAYCYDKQLLAHPELAGEVMVQFLIGPDGTVQASTGRGFDSTVASCVAEVVHSIAFPRPNGPVQVNYPFTFQRK